MVTIDSKFSVHANVGKLIILCNYKYSQSQKSGELTKYVKQKNQSIKRQMQEHRTGSKAKIGRSSAKNYVLTKNDTKYEQKVV